MRNVAAPTPPAGRAGAGHARGGDVGPGGHGQRRRSFTMTARNRREVVAIADASNRRGRAALPIPTELREGRLDPGQVLAHREGRAKAGDAQEVPQLALRADEAERAAAGDGAVAEADQ